MVLSHQRCCRDTGLYFT